MSIFSKAGQFLKSPMVQNAVGSLTSGNSGTTSSGSSSGSSGSGWIDKLNGVLGQIKLPTIKTDNKVGVEQNTLLPILGVVFVFILLIFSNKKGKKGKN